MLKHVLCVKMSLSLRNRKVIRTELKRRKRVKNEDQNDQNDQVEFNLHLEDSNIEVEQPNKRIRINEDEATKKSDDDNEEEVENESPEIVEEEEGQDDDDDVKSDVEEEAKDDDEKSNDEEEAKVVQDDSGDSDDETEEAQNHQSKKKRARASYFLLKKFQTYEALDTYIRTNNTHPVKRTHNDPYPCSLCNDHHHKMKKIYLKCNCGDNNDECDLKYSIQVCNNNLNEWILYQAGEHDVKKDKEKIIKKPAYSLPVLIESLFNEILETDQSISAKKLLSRISLARKRNMQKPEEERVDKYNFNKKLLPSLTEVIN